MGFLLPGPPRCCYYHHYSPWRLRCHHQEHHQTQYHCLHRRFLRNQGLHVWQFSSAAESMSRLQSSGPADNASLLAGVSVLVSVASLLLSLRTWRRQCDWEETEIQRLSSLKDTEEENKELVTKATKHQMNEQPAPDTTSKSTPLNIYKRGSSNGLLKEALESGNPENNATSLSQPITRIRETLENQILANTTNNSLTVEPIGVVRSIYRLCVGTPRQGLLAPHARGKIEITLPVDAAVDSVKELETFSHIWILFVFHLNTMSKTKKVSPKIAPPALGGKKVGLLATRSPHRFNPIGMTLAKLERVEIKPKNIHKSQKQKGSRVVLHISGLDLVDGTPVLDVKPFVPTYDSVDQWNGSSQAQAQSNTSSSVKLPPWVSEGLATRRTVTISETARRDLEIILATCQSSSSSKKNQPALEFYGHDSETQEDALENMLSCIVEVLAMDVRSSFQTKKARKGNYHAERAQRITQKKPSQDNGTMTLEPDLTGAAESRINTCTQQLDNLLLHYTVNEAAQLQRPETSEGSGAEDQVCVTSVEYLQ